AEDGIRDFHVTGVQTCALPISNSHLLRVLSLRLPSAQGISEFAIGTLGAGVGAQHVEGRGRGGDLTVQLLDGCFVLLYPYRQPRSEERRVGKECRSRWSPEPSK